MTKKQYKSYKARFLKQKENVIFNYSSVTLTKDMETIFNKGLNFAIIPLKLDRTQVLTDLKRFERTMIWKEFGHNREGANSGKKAIFKQKKKTICQENIRVLNI